MALYKYLLFFILIAVVLVGIFLSGFALGQTYSKYKSEQPQQECFTPAYVKDIINYSALQFNQYNNTINLTEVQR